MFLTLFDTVFLDSNTSENCLNPECLLEAVKSFLVCFINTVPIMSSYFFLFFRDLMWKSALIFVFWRLSQYCMTESTLSVLKYIIIAGLYLLIFWLQFLHQCSWENTGLCLFNPLMCSLTFLLGQFSFHRMDWKGLLLFYFLRNIIENY